MTVIYSKTFWKIVRNGSTEDFESAPYVVTLLSSSLWVYYGITKPDGFLVATVNGVGIILEAIYVTLFLIYATPSLRVRSCNNDHQTIFSFFFFFFCGNTSKRTFYLFIYLFSLRTKNYISNIMRRYCSISGNNTFFFLFCLFSFF